MKRPRALARSVYRRIAPLVSATRLAGDRVSEADVRAAYRLLLGRVPDPDGWQSFSAMVGIAPTSDLVGALLSSEEFRRTAMHSALMRRERDDLEEVDASDGLRLLVSPHDLSNQGLLRRGSYETHLARALDDVLRPGMSFCAVGANVGYHVVRAAHRVGPRGRVFAFEAHPGNALLVARSVALNRFENTTVLPFAVADRRTLHRYVAAQGTNGYLEPLDAQVSSDADTLRSALLIQSICLDDLLGLLSPIDVLQIDIEGGEGRALRGAQRLLAENRPVVFSELCLGQLSRNSAMSGEEYLGGLRSLGYGFAVLGFDGAITPFGDDVERLCAYARAQSTSHIDIRCAPSERR